ncbi:MAG: dCTP deaminase [Candidatus Brocadiia bacterium]
MEPGELFDEWLEDAVYRDKQVDRDGVHLTVGQVSRLEARGSIDFGGGELEQAPATAIEPVKRDPADDYGWWNLRPGAYVVTFNESVRDGAPPLLLVTNNRLLSCGCAIAPIVLSGGRVRSVLTVADHGVAIKENARAALLRPVG